MPIRPNQSQSEPFRAIRPNQPSDLAPGKSIGRVAQARALPSIGALAVEEWSGDPKLTWRRRTTLVPVGRGHAVVSTCMRPKADVAAARHACTW
jgi:hypothetical protein